MLTFRVNLNSFQRIKLGMVYSLTIVELSSEVTGKKETRKFPNIWRLNNIFIV